ncbi:MAG: sulfatase [Pseudomonadota bacterium]
MRPLPALPLLFTLACGPPAPAGPPDIILVSMDTLRADRLGAYGSTAGLTPNLDHFAAEAVVFDDAWAVANETLYSHGAAFTARYATETGPIFDTFRLAEACPTLAGVLGVYGYQTAGFTGGGHLSEGFGLGRGFATWEVSQGWGSLYHSVPDALRWLDARASEAPFFLFVHGYDTHHRYLKPGPYGFAHVRADQEGAGPRAARGNLGTVQMVDGWFFPRLNPPDLLDFRALRVRGPGERRRIERLARRKDMGAEEITQADIDFVRGVYDGAVSYGDAWFGLFMAALQRRGVLDHAVVVLMSDHGEELGEDGLFHHRYSLSDITLRVPLMVRLPGGEGGGRHLSGIVELTDLMPTLLEAAGAEVPAGVRGHSRWPALHGAPLEGRPAAFSQTMFRAVSARAEDGRLTFSGVDADSPYLADLLRVTPLGEPAFEATPGLAPSRQEELRQALVVWAEGLAQPSADGATGPSPAQIETMHEQGYWGTP